MPSKLLVRSATAFVTSAAVLAGICMPAHAQETSATAVGNWTFDVAPYVWFAGLKGEVGAIPGQPVAEVDASFGDIIENTDFAFMLAAQAQRGRFGVVTDIAYLSLSASGDTPEPQFGEVEAENDTVVATVAGFYRRVEGDRLNFDVLAGARIWHVETEIDLDAGLLPATRVGGGELWADPVVGLRGNVRLGRGVFMTATADIGGFGLASDFTWQILGTIGYRFNDRLSVRAGYRYLKVDYENDGFVWDVQLSGPILGASFRF